LLDLELFGSLDVTAWCAGVLELLGGLVVIATLSDSWVVALDAQVMGEDRVFLLI
jgi:hypothetical protein